MSLNINNTYAPLATPPSASYPTGSIKDETIPSVSNDGTPLTAEWGNDYVGFTDALLDAASMSHSGVADTALSSDRLKALLQITNGARPITGGGSLRANERHLIIGADTYTLPNTASLTNGKTVVVLRHGDALISDPTPTIQVEGSNGESVEYYDSSGLLTDTDTSVSYNVTSMLTFVFNATSGNWEL